MSAGEVLGDRVREWFTFEAWNSVDQHDHRRR
jgi:hypothetical protein